VSGSTGALLPLAPVAGLPVGPVRDLRVAPSPSHLPVLVNATCTYAAACACLLENSAGPNHLRSSLTRTMSRRGVWQLTKLTLNYCAHSGSSRGARCVSCGRDMAPLSLPAQRLHSRGA